MDFPEQVKQALLLFNKLKKSPLFFAIISLVIIVTFFSFSSALQTQHSQQKADSALELGAFPITIPNIKYGFALDTFMVSEGIIKENQFLADILLKHKVDYVNIDKLARNDTFDVRQLRFGKPFTILSRDTSQSADYFIYEPSVYEYVVFSLKDSLDVYRVRRPITNSVNKASGIIESSLWNTMIDNGLSYELTAKLEDALQWSIDFHHLQKNDRFKVVYDEKSIEGNTVGVGKVHAAYYKNLNNEYYAIYYENGEHVGYYDKEGHPMKRTFLKAPVKYSRISSRYNRRRFHPILRRVRPHLGTDYAAPYGTPIYAVGNGVVTHAGYTKGNGRYVKIKHDKTYQTQYLHMQGFAKDIRSGAHVKQGQVIGYVGSTGLATGPHVCFRFWKNGKQVNHLNITFPPAKPLPEEELPKFFEIRDKYLSELEGIKFKVKEPSIELEAKVDSIPTVSITSPANP